jgi:DNA polymerase/3'-5' exonuclease PolX
MGFRTVVILNNDLAHLWSKDPELGSSIFHTNSAGDIKNYGSVIECVHADAQSLMVVESLSAKTLAQTWWWPNEIDMELTLLKEAAEKLGYRLSKIPSKK